MSPEADPAGGLVRRQASALEIFSQALAATGPSVGAAGVPAAVFLVAGTGTLWAILIAMVVVLLVAVCVSMHTRRSATAGSLSTFTRPGLGPGGAFASGWALLIGYTMFAAASIVLANLYLTGLLKELHVDGAGIRIVQALMIVAISIPTVWAPLRGLSISMRFALVLELVSLAVVLVIFVLTLIRHGAHVDTSLLTAKGASWSHILLGVVVGVGAFTGFESAASLGVEARDPYRSIPRAILGVSLGVGVLFLVAAYTEIVGFDGKFSASSAPLNDLAVRTGLSGVSPIIDIALTIAMLGCAAAVLNAGARSLYTLAKEQVIPPVFGRTRKTVRTPHVAVLTLAPLAVVPAVVLSLTGTPAITASVFFGVIGAFGFMTSYFLVSVATVVQLVKKRSSPLVAIAGTVAALSIAYVAFRNVVPAPPMPFAALPYVYAGLLALGLIWFGYLWITRPERARNAGSLEETEDMPCA
ncbi:APC family permease [Streptomyces sp. NPDC046821]|uniref:APC family permease n=1 Tax=Streptomyces sp. NPDC046821 TaxID=3154702 RepID=UPI0033F6AFA1